MKKFEQVAPLKAIIHQYIYLFKAYVYQGVSNLMGVDMSNNHIYTMHVHNINMHAIPVAY